MARIIQASRLSQVVDQLYRRACVFLPRDVEQALERAWYEESGTARLILEDLLENARLARVTGLPLCQDTGLTMVRLDVGQEVAWLGEDVEKAIDAGVASACRRGYLRSSVVTDPIFDRSPTGDNTPAFVHFQCFPGDRVKITVAPRGGGSENQGSISMLSPGAGETGLKEQVLSAVRQGAARACPPLIVGVGVGGTMEIAAQEAKWAALRPLDRPAASARLQELENRLWQDVNALGIGPQGVGGRVTALAVHLAVRPAHLATMPVAVALQCHSVRRATGWI